MPSPAASVVTICATSKNLDGLDSLTVNGGAGGATLTVHDEANPHTVFSNTYTVTSASLTRTSWWHPAGLIGYLSLTTPITYVSLKGLTLNDSNLNNIVNVQSTAPGVPVTVFGARDTTHGKINADLGKPDDPATKALFDFLADALKK